MKPFSGATRLIGFDSPTVWTIMTPLAIQTKSVNLGQGFPSWQPPPFYMKHCQQSLENSSHQYSRAYGSLTYTKAIAEYHKNTYKGLDIETNIVTVQGGVQGLFCAFLGLVNQGQEVILFDPSYDCYRPQVQMAGGKCIGIPLQPKIHQTKEQLKARCEKGYFSGEEDLWEINFEAFQKALNPKTKILLLNTPHNPVGKVFSQAELGKIAAILRKHPQVIVVEDNVYEGMTFDDMYNQKLPKMVFEEGMFDRTLSVYSAGKIFSATGVRSGWVIGPANLIKAVRSVHQYSVFCSYGVLQNAISRSLETISRPEDTYMKDYAKKLQTNRDLLLTELINSKYDFDLWVPKGGYFIIADISRVQVSEKYLKDNQGRPRSKDYAFAFQLAYQNGVVCIPCSSFYSPEDVLIGERYVRFAFCKDVELIQDAGKRLTK